MSLINNAPSGNDIVESINTLDSGKQNNLTESQLNAVNSGINSELVAQIGTNQTNISNIQDLIPDQASSSNKLTDKNFVNSSIQTSTAEFDGSWDTYALIPTTIEGFTNIGLPVPTKNNYLIVREDETRDNGTWRYKYVEGTSSGYSKSNWHAEYEVNETPLTAAQLAALNSGVTSSSVNQISTNTDDIATLQSNKADRSELETLASSKANVGLDNLNADGQMVIDSVNGTISNCILGIPQNIKLTLENNVLTLKAGSILTRSGITYSTITTTEDYSLTILSSWQEGRYVVVNYGSSWFRSCLIQSTCSGSTDTMESMPTHIWFDTTTQEVKSFQAGASSYTVFPYPICLIDIIDGVASFAKDSNGNDLIFNGAGFIGHHAFVYPNVKALIPNGFNADGSLKNIKVTTTSILLNEMNEANVVFNIGQTNIRYHEYIEVNSIDDVPNPIDYGCYYARNTNTMHVWHNTWSVLRNTPIIFFTYNGTTVTDFTIRQPYEGARDLLAENIDGTIYTAGDGIVITDVSGQENTKQISISGSTLMNKSTVISSLSILGSGTTSGSSINIGPFSLVFGAYSTALGTSASISLNAEYSIAIGASAMTTSNYAIQLGRGTNTEANSFYVSTSASNNWKMLGSDGKIPEPRIPSTIARSSDIITYTAGTGISIGTDHSISVTQVGTKVTFRNWS